MQEGWDPNYAQKNKYMNRRDTRKNQTSEVLEEQEDTGTDKDLTPETNTISISTDGMSTSQTNSTPSDDESIEDFLQNLKASEEFQKMIVPRSFQLTDTQTKEVVDKFAESQKLSKNQALVVITLLFQSGGTNRSCDGNLQVSIFNKQIKLANLRKVLNECKLKANERKLARSLASKIEKIAKELSIPGNLAKKITREFPERKFTMEELVWLSEFQVDNPSCPEESRKLISDCLKKRKENTGAKKPKGNRK